MPGWVSRLSYDLPDGFANHLISGSLSSPLRPNTCCLSSRNRLRKRSNPPRRRASCSVLDQRPNVFSLSSDANGLKICKECCRSNALGTGPRFIGKTRHDRPGGIRGSCGEVRFAQREREPCCRATAPSALSFEPRSLHPGCLEGLTVTWSLPNNSTTPSWRGPTDSSLGRIRTLRTRSWSKDEPH